MQLSSTTEERDRLKIIIDQLKQQKNVEAGAAMTDGKVKVVGERSCLEVLFGLWFVLMNLLHFFSRQGQELEASLAMKEDLIKKLESSILEQKDVNARQHNEIKLLNERLSNESRRIKSLEREDDRLRSEIAILESKV